MKEKNDIDSYVFLFQGMGVRYLDYCGNFNEELKKCFSDYCRIIKKSMNLDLWAYCYDKRFTTKDEEMYDGLLLYTIDYLLFKTAITNNIKPGILLGYSLGLNTAAVCSGAISFEDGAKILYESFKYRDSFIEAKEGMTTIIGLELLTVKEIIYKNNLQNGVEIAIENNESCIVISGLKNEVDEVVKVAMLEGAIKTKKIETKYSFHSKYAKLGIDRYVNTINNTKISNPKIQIRSCFTQDNISDAESLKEVLIKNLYTSMKWKDCIQTLINNGYMNFIEISCTDAISKFSKEIDLNCKFISVNKLLN